MLISTYNFLGKTPNFDRAKNALKIQLKMESEVSKLSPPQRTKKGGPCDLVTHKMCSSWY